MAEKSYSAESLQVLSGLEPVRRRPGMYTDTTRPNHLVQESLQPFRQKKRVKFAQGMVLMTSLFMEKKNLIKTLKKNFQKN